MKSKRQLFSLTRYALLYAVLFSSCRNLKNISSSNAVVNLDTVVVRAFTPEIYQAARTKPFDLIHTKLDVKFDWEKQYLYGKAALVMKPYFYPQSALDIDAKGFNINRVSILKHSAGAIFTPPMEWGSGAETDTIDLKYSYDSLNIHIFLPQEYTRNDTFCIYIDYTAKPNERKSKGSAAITSAKGLYFINADGKDTAKPKQIWTQGETEASSCWFPTFDSPNEKMTQEIFITVDKQYLTLSNGMPAYQIENNNGTRTDYWKQSLPHSPYLTMMAIGSFSVLKDQWRGKEVNYYVEPKYEKYAKTIFGNTPEMLEFYSGILGVEYPWEKFSQIVVRDYVSGAMENTSAVIHGEFLQQTDREMIDQNFEDVIAHELFHHWFGDLVTCESWANLPLNESFATLGEYLWIEHKYGREEADYHQQQDFVAYFGEASREKKNLIRFNYNDKEDMFDRHSYQKGGVVLNMLRRYVGDDAFFASLKNYLTKNKFSTAEIHQLRLSFEEVTGEDLNWFFNQWFLNSGHPELSINYEYNDSLKQQKIMIEQKQTSPVFRLPLYVDIYFNGKKERHKIVLVNQYEEFSFKVSAKPDLVNVDAEKTLLCEKNDYKEISQWIFQYYNAPLYTDRYEALIRGAAWSQNDSLAAKLVLDALNDKHWNIRLAAIKSLDFLPTYSTKDAKNKIMEMANKDGKSSVRTAAIQHLNKNYKDEEVMKLYKNAMEDLSYTVIGEALYAIAADNKDEGMKYAKQLEQENTDLNPNILHAIASIYAEKGGESESSFFVKNINESKGFGKINFIVYYETFLKNESISDETLNTGIDILKNIAENDETFYTKLYAMKALSNLENEFAEREKSLDEKLKKKENNTSKKQDTDNLARVSSQKKKLTAIVDNLKKNEADLKMNMMFGN